MFTCLSNRAENNSCYLDFFSDLKPGLKSNICSTILLTKLFSISEYFGEMVNFEVV